MCGTRAVNSSNFIPVIISGYTVCHSQVYGTRLSLAYDRNFCPTLNVSIGNFSCFHSSYHNKVCLLRYRITSAAI